MVHTAWDCTGLEQTASEGRYGLPMIQDNPNSEGQTREIREPNNSSNINF